MLETRPRLLLLTGAERNFAGGADIAELCERGRDEALRGINSRLFDRIARLRLPTVAAVDGYALGGGAVLAYACDIRLATPAAVFGNPEPGLGILAAAGACWRLAELVPAPDLLEQAHSVLDRVGRSSSTALRLTRAILDAQGPHPLADDLAQAVLFESEDKRDRMTRFLERRKP